MTIEEIEKLAFSGKPLSGFPDMPEVSLYQAFSNLYARYKHHYIDRETAQAEKKQILKAYNRCITERDKYLETRKEYQHNIIQNAEYLREMEKEVDNTALFELSLNIIANMTNDLDFPKRMIKKWSR